MIAVPGEAMAWARECLAAGDAPEELAMALGLSEEQLLCAAGVHTPMTPRQREAASLRAAGLTDAEAAGRMERCTAAAVSNLLRTARSNGYAIALRSPGRQPDIEVLGAGR